MNLDDRELEQHIASVKIPYDPRNPGGEINLKAKRRWEILRRTESYRRDWDEAFSRMVEMLKLAPGPIGPEDFGFETDPEKLIKDPEKRTVENIFKENQKIEKEFRKRMVEFRKDPPAWEEFLKRKFERDWPPKKLKEEFLYSQYVTEGRELADKYNLSIPYHYDDPLWDPNKDKMKSVIKDMEPVRMISHNPSKYERGPKGEPVADHRPNLLDNRWLTVEIDLYTDSIEAVWNRLKSMIDFYRPLCSPRNIGKRGPGIDFCIDTEKGKVSIYELWNMSKKDGKSPWQITQELYPAATQDKDYQLYEKNYDKKVRAKWMRIKTAIKRADKEIKEAEIKINSTL